MRLATSKFLNDTPTNEGVDLNFYGDYPFKGYGTKANSKGSRTKRCTSLNPRVIWRDLRNDGR